MGYDSNGAMCDKHIKLVTEKLTDYTYEVKNNPAKIKEFLLESFASLMPLVQSINVK